MHKSGHLGFALLGWAPIALQLIEAGALGLALAGGVVCLGLTQLPDVDMSVSVLRHRGPTHSITFALAVGAICARAFEYLEETFVDLLGADSPTLALAPAAPVAPFVPDSSVVAVGALAGVVAILAHVAADAVTHAGVEPMWPVCRARYSLNLVNADNALVNQGVFYVGCAAMAWALLYGTGWADPLLAVVGDVLDTIDW